MIIDQTGLIEIILIFSSTVLGLTALNSNGNGGSFSIKGDKNGGSIQVEAHQTQTNKTKDCLPSGKNSHSSDCNTQ